MAGTKEGAALAKQSELDRYVEEFNVSLNEAENIYRQRRRSMGAKGGRKTYKSGKLDLVNFRAHPERAEKWGAIGGRISRRGPSKKHENQ